MRVIIALFALLGTFLSAEATAHACSCLPPDMARSYDHADDVVRAEVRFEWFTTSQNRYYIASVEEEAFKGCIEASQWVLVKTARSSAACGTTLSVGESYLLTASDAGSFWGLPILQVGLCDYSRPFNELNGSDLDFLYSRYNCCGDECACTDGNRPVNCLVDPCQMETCDVEGAECRSNYCGGCNAEWVDATGAEVECGADPECDYDDGRSWVSEDAGDCERIRFVCDEGMRPFFEDCGCGCEPEPEPEIDCVVGGCSGQLCVPDGERIATTCEWRPEYACYRTATCEQQPGGGCGWTATPELETCLDEAGGDLTL